MAEEALTEAPQVSPEEQAALDIGNQIAAELQGNPEPAPEPEAIIEDGEVTEPESVEAEPEQVEAEPEGPELEEIEFNGQILEAPADVADALRMSQDYTQKTQQLSADRKTLEAVQGEMTLIRQQYEFAATVQEDLRNAQILEGQAEQARQMLRQQVDQLSSTDIEKVRMGIDDLLRQRDELVNSMKSKTAEFQQAQEQSVKELRDKCTEALRSKIPGWGDEQHTQARAYALDMGFSEAEVDATTDPRYFEVLHKAALYDALKAGAKTTVSQVQAAPTIRPKGSNPMPAETRQKLDYRNRINSKKLTAKQKAKEMERHFGEKFS